MNVSYDYYNQLEGVELYLCNPDESELFVLPAYNRQLTLRFNDLSTLTFIVSNKARTTRGETVGLASYDYIQTQRLVKLTKVGWFKITEVHETDDGVEKAKSVTCESYQSIFKDRGILTDETTYYLYNPSDPFDEGYKYGDIDVAPSVLGQLYQQLGIKQDLTQGTNQPVTPYADWTITYVPSEYIGTVARSFDEESSTGYDFMVNKVEKAFEVLFVFDFMYKTIQIKLPTEVTTMSNVIFTFSNFMQNIDVEEKSDEIVTVLDCTSDGIDITSVNPTGTNYLCNFDYYMDQEGKWMSSALKAKLSAWKTLVTTQTPQYMNFISQLKQDYQSKAEIETQLSSISNITTDINVAFNKKAMAYIDGATINGIVKTEKVATNANSLDSNSNYYQTPFTSASIITTHKEQPTYNAQTHTWSFSTTGITGTADYCYNYVDEQQNQYLYFVDSASPNSYCKLTGKATIDATTYEHVYTVSGYERYNELNDIKYWSDLYVTRTAALNQEIFALDADIDTLLGFIQGITSSTNIVSYFADTPALYKELTCYWIEGEYNNDNIKLLDDMDLSQQMALAEELRDAGYIELEKISQPRFSFKLNAIDFLNNSEFADQAAGLALGRIITVEKAEGIWYYPALLEMGIDLDNHSQLELTFGNSLRLDDWGYTYGDLMSKVSSSIKKVGNNWSALTSYAKNKDSINALIRQPLDATLRASFANMVNQEFHIDSEGILGRRFIDSSNNEYSDEQIRIINNVIVFTDDGWDTAKTALGKIYYTDPDTHQQLTAYGLVAEAIIGNLVMTEKLKIVNSNSTVNINSDGISIVDSQNNTVFLAKPDGTVAIKGYDSDADLSVIYAKKTDGATNTFGYTLNASGFSLVANGTTRLAVSQNSATLAGWYFDANNLYQYATGSYSGFYSGSMYTSASLVTPGTYSPIRIYAGAASSSNLNGAKFRVLEDGSLYASAGSFTGNVIATSGTFTNDGTYIPPQSSVPSPALCNIASGVITLTSGQSRVVTLNPSGCTLVSGNASFRMALLSGGDRLYVGGSTSGDAYIVFDASNDKATLYGTWESQSAITVTSDRNKKKHIEDLDEKYDRLFECLVPRRFMYVHGNSGRYHLGYIAQEVEDAILKAGLTTKEFAGFVRMGDDGNPNTYTYGLRYEEFIALNSRQIQLLKEKVALLEEEISTLKGEQ